MSRKATHHTRAYLGNSVWLLLGKTAQIGLTFLVGVISVRYLGPYRFGLFSFATAVIAFLAPVNNLGMNAMAQREYLNHPSEADSILQTVLLLKTIAGGVLFAGLAAVTAFMSFDDNRAKLLLLIAGSGMVLSGFSTVYGSWFQSQIQAKYAVIAVQLGGAVRAVSRVGCVLGRMSLVWFAVTEVVGKLATSITAMVLYRSRAGISPVSPGKFDLRRGGRLLRESMWYMSAAMAAVVYLKIDQIMIGRMLNMTELGVYSSAVRVTQIACLLPGVLMGTLYPLLVRARRRSDQEYQQQLQSCYNLMFAVSLPLALTVTAAAGPLVRGLYGEAFSAAAPILTLHIWGTVFVFWGAVLNKWFIMESFSKFALYRSLTGAAVNIGLNVVLIPRFHGLGAAVATVVSYAAANLLFTFFSGKSRPCGVYALKSIVLFPLAYTRIRSLLSKIRK